MATREKFRPFTGDSEKRILLSNAPLELMLVQLRWPELGHLQVGWRDRALGFGSSLGALPLFSESRERSFSITPSGVREEDGDPVFNWSSVDGVHNVSLGRRFFSFYTTTYTSYADFSEHLIPLISKIHSELQIPLLERVGVRYVNRIADRGLLDNLVDYVRPELVGFAALAGDDSEVQLTSSTNLASYAIGPDVLQVRTGVLPANETLDAAIAPLSEASFVIDLDASRSGQMSFDAASGENQVGRLADIAYDFFKLVVTDGFVHAFGGEPV